MRGTLAVARRELGALVDSPVAWVTAALFVVALHAAFFFVGFPIGDRPLPSLWAGRVATLQPLFAWLPLLLALLAPALAMGAWAEERRTGTEELLLAQPLAVRAAVAGKFLARLALVAALVACAVLPAALAVARLGPLDWGAVWGGVAGGVLLAASYLAVALACSALASDELVAYLVGAAVLVALWAAAPFVRALPPALAEAAWYASPAVHYLDTAARGVLDARDAVYHALLALVGLYANTALVEARRWG